MRTDGPDRTAARRWSARILAGGIAAAALLTAIHMVVQERITSTMDPTETGRRFERWAEGRLDRDVEIGGVRLRTLPRPGVELRRVRVAHRPGTTEPWLGIAPAVLLEVDLLALLLGRVEVRKISLRSPDLNLSDEPGGGWPEPGGARGREPPVALQIRELAVTEGALSYRDRRGRMRMESEGVRLEVRRRAPTDGWELDVRLGVRRVRGQPPPPLPSFGPTEVGGRLTLEGSGDSVRLARSPIRIGPARLSLSGRRGADGSFRLAGELQGLPLQELSLLPGSGRAAGGVTGRFALHRPSHGSDVRVAGRYRLHDLSVELRGDELIHAGHGSGRLRGDTLLLDSLSARVGGEPAELSGRLGLRPGVPYTLSFDGEPGVSSLLELLRPQATKGQGRVRARLRASGSLDPAPLPRSLSGTIAPRGVRLSHPALPAPLSLPEGRLRLEGREIRARSLPILVGRQAFAFTGTASGLLDLLRDPSDRRRSDPGRPERPTVRGSLTGSSLDLRRLLRAVPDRPRPSPVDVNLTVRVDTLQVGPAGAGAVEARVRMGAQMLTVGPARARIWGGTARPDLTLGLDEGGPTAFGLRLRMDSLRVGPALGQLQGGRGRPPVEGRMTGRVEVSGETSPSLSPARELLAGSATLELTDGRLTSTPAGRALAHSTGLVGLRAPAFSAARIRVRFSGAGLTLDSLRMETPRATIRARGSVGFDGRGRLDVGLTVPFSRLDPTAPVWNGSPPAARLGRTPDPERPVVLQLRLTREAGEPGEVRVELRGLHPEGAPRDPVRPPLPAPGSHTSGRRRSADRPATRAGAPTGSSTGPLPSPHSGSSPPRIRPGPGPADAHPRREPP